METVELLKELGLEKASENVQGKIDLSMKLTIAYEHYRVVTPKIIERFQDELKRKTKKKLSHGGISYDRLAFVALKDYAEVPPEHALLALKEAKKRNCFDYFEVAKVETVEERPDPIIFGRVDKSPDRFFVTQWDDDVRIEDILRANEG